MAKKVGDRFPEPAEVAEVLVPFSYLPSGDLFATKSGGGGSDFIPQTLQEPSSGFSGPRTSPLSSPSMGKTPPLTVDALDACPRGGHGQHRVAHHFVEADCRACRCHHADDDSRQDRGGKSAFSPASWDSCWSWGRRHSCFGRETRSATPIPASLSRNPMIRPGIEGRPIGAATGRMRSRLSRCNKPMTGRRWTNHRPKTRARVNQVSPRGCPPPKRSRSRRRKVQRG